MKAQLIKKKTVKIFEHCHGKNDSVLKKKENENTLL